MRSHRFVAAAICLSLSPGLASAQTATPAPSGPAPSGAGQPSGEVDCAAIATQQTGYDPSRPPPQATANPQVAGSGSRARGAAAGAAIGSMSDAAGQGAAAGAVAGGVAQRSRNRRSTRQQNDAMAQQQQAGQAAYNQALSNCLAKHGHSGG
jgi:hypothetical protein